MKFILTIYFCSVIAGDCKNGMIYPKEFDTFKECLYSGYNQSMMLLDEYPTEMINEFQVLTKFTCTENKNKAV
tara:strand:- start:606 stop:824 length:219 start_codon:yes stop_codon:yes gene_type:complete